MKLLRARQVHLDFHTSEHIADVGKQFSEKQFQKALKLGHVNSVTIFAKCHHSWSYYPTKAGMVHPTLKTDLMGRQIKAAHAIGVRAPIYITVGWSETDALQHPEWVVRNRDGSLAGSNKLDAKPDDKRPICTWHHMCVCEGGGYRELILAQTEEVCKNYPTDGIFYDICMMTPCWCAHCSAGMKREGVDLDDREAVAAYSKRKWLSFMAACREVIFKHHSGATVFFNGLAGIGESKDVLDMQTHFELEDLPTTWGGYDKFAPRAHYFAKLDRPMLAMSGKFHTMWGEFGGFKHPDAIKFEAASMIAGGAACSMGDQLHPSGEMDLSTYANIGAGYAYVEKIELLGLGGVPVSTLGVLLSKSRAKKVEGQIDPDHHDQGVFNMLMEAQLEFEIAELHELSRFDTIVLTGSAWLDAASAKAIADYVKKGGKVLALYESALDTSKEKLLLDVGGKLLGTARYELDYTAVAKPFGTDLPATPYLNYTPALRLKPAGGKSLGAIHEPYFNRTYAKFCSHQNTANQLSPAEHVAGLQKGRVIYLAHALGEMYYKHGARVHRQLFLNALRKLHTQPTVETTMPSAGRISLLELPTKNQHALHLTYGPPLQRGRCLVIDDLPVLHDIPVTLRLGTKVKKVSLPLSKKKLSFKQQGKSISFTLPRLQCHEVVLIES
jgi:hypothetical protein